ncbi:MAG: RdgB/HAM1 family non-canonical purine NTP pyrophosphatase [Saprospiraceae bacterium]|nr:RdgB/HAM1 family non-canonical purine NTP pyrophosphatase [Saprospiraceae bacterium]HMW39196.1 RdgB/HAM1 family non-canonical purine NTP pyrophosphatase [Saprospiraceae bacterium]HMX89191.1 RdgB/HAM1 family non-canonical purine NTP pyrophosphatase [Saprospiraceae bacterium]HMZ40600.1 RdgB/HAM1 family non-canonical purine NTP pyrophosphatase [Saprospiraceae bacterium]HNA65760.1 RdgB/HAM1 family non-canonical purine NTP pyrophosphatase [Saprospiraceae bacterium]
MKLLLSSRNLHKLEEIRAILPATITVEPWDSDVEIEESADTFEGNAFIKAYAGWEQMGIPCLGEDSGLSVPALGGAPGVMSARFAGEPRSDFANIQLLLKQMEGVHDRSAYFTTVLALVMDGNEYSFEGRVEGRIATAIHGAMGFGYDPVFIPEGYDQTFAELGPLIKNHISHRARALSKLTAFLKAFSC